MNAKINNYLHTNLVKLVKANKAEIVVSNLLEINKIVKHCDKSPKDMALGYQKILELVDQTLTYLANKGDEKEDDDNGYVTISSTVELSDWQKLQEIAKFNNMTINKMLSEWFNWVINDRKVLKIRHARRLEHTGHTFKRIGCCIPKFMAKILDSCLAEAGVSRYECIKIWVDELVSQYDSVQVKLKKK